MVEKSHTRILLIGGTSHVGKSTLGKAWAIKLDWDYISTDSLGKHPGRPWITVKNREIKEHVAQHYSTLSVEALLSDVLSHYQKNILPQVKAIIQTATFANKCLVIEGSALYPKFVHHFLEQQIDGIWLTASDRLLTARILRESNFYGVDKDAQYLITKFIARTLLYNQSLQEDILHLELKSIKLERDLKVEELTDRCSDFIKGY